MSSSSSSRWRIAAFAHCVKAFFGDRSGNVAMLFGLAAIPFFAVGGMAVDFSRALEVKTRLGAALDATALAIAAQPNLSEKEALKKADAQFKANYPASDLGTPSKLKVVFATGTVTISASATVDTVVIGLIPGWDKLTVDSSVEVKRNSSSLEVSLVLDITGSMGNPSSRIASLKDAATKLVDILVWDDQSRYTSKVALVPYSIGVNLGSYASAARGTIAAVGKKDITAATKTNPVVVTTAAAHGFVNGQMIYISNVSGMTQLNSKYYLVANVTATTFQLQTTAGVNVNGTGYSTYSTSANDFAYCAFAGCTTYTFTSDSGSINTQNISTCVTERIGPQAYTDISPSTAPVGLNYPSTSNPCPTATIVPLTSNKTTLKNAITALTATGSTAGQIGIGWGWYMLSPNFASLWPSQSQPAPYHTDELLKIAIIMTDGAFNTPYCNGVIAKDAGTGSGNTSDHNSCNATNGDPFAQAKKLCTNMKAQGILVYTVGFDIGTDVQAVDVLSTCATDSSKAYLANDNAALIKAFQDIAIEISNLRISK